MKMKARAIVAMASAANTILPMVAPEEGLSTSVQANSSVVRMEIRTPDPELRREVTDEKLEKFLTKLDLGRITDWPDEDQQEVQKTPGRTCQAVCIK